MTAGARDKAIEFATTLGESYNATVGLNDMSLISGGLFDIGPTSKHPEWQLWQNPHISHRKGTSLDVDRCALSTIGDRPDERITCPVNYVRIDEIDFENYCNAAQGHIVPEETFHCEF